MDNITPFTADVLSAVIRGDQYEQPLFRQLPLLRVTEYEYTGVGVFIYFSGGAVVETDRIPETRYILDGVEVQSNELELGASAIL